jgi:hypothetical protein
MQNDFVHANFEFSYMRLRRMKLSFILLKAVENLILFSKQICLGYVISSKLWCLQNFEFQFVRTVCMI